MRAGVESLILHFAPTSVEHLTAPPDIARIAGELITITENLVPRSGVPEMPSDQLGDRGQYWRRSPKTWEVGGSATKIYGLPGRELRS